MRSSTLNFIESLASICSYYDESKALGERFGKYGLRSGVNPGALYPSLAKATTLRKEEDVLNASFAESKKEAMTYRREKEAARRKM